MARAILQRGLKLLTVLLRALARPSRPGWKHSSRPVSLRGR